MDIQVLQLNTHRDNWARVYLEPNNQWSEGGGRITVNLGDDYIGSHFFSHVSGNSFDDFIANCGTDYLVHKLFKTNFFIPVTDTTELFECISREYIDVIKQARSSVVSKEQLRYLYEDVCGRDFVSMFDLSNQLDRSCCDTMNAIFGDDWWFEEPFKKRNDVYDWQLQSIKIIQEKIKANAVKEKSQLGSQLL